MLPVKLHASAALIKSNLQLKRLIGQDLLHNPNLPQTLLKEVQCEYTVGIPRGRFSFRPGFGIKTLRVGFDFPVIDSSLASSRRATGDMDLTPSTPAVFFPWFSCVTRRTAKTLLDQDLINVFWSLRTRLTLPWREAAYMRFCSLKTSLSTLRQLISFQSSVIVSESELAIFTATCTYPLSHTAVHVCLSWLLSHLFSSIAR